MSLEQKHNTKGRKTEPKYTNQGRVTHLSNRGAPHDSKYPLYRKPETQTTSKSTARDT